VGIDEGADADVWVKDLSGTRALQRLTLEGHNRFPVWSPNGRSVTFQSDRDGTASMYSQASDGGSAAVRLTEAAQDVSHVPESWSPDGHTLLFSEQKGGTFSLMTLSVGDKRVAPFGGVQSREPPEAVFSPDGKWVAYSVNPGLGGVQSPDRGIFVQPFPATGAKYQVPRTALDFHPAWGPLGKEIFFVSTVVADNLTSVGVQTQSTVTFEDLSLRRE
jgi:Tol biopolymer transport system component